MPKIVQPQVDFETAEEFLEAVSPTGSLFKNEMPNAPWLFRGQDRDWPLVPSLFRDKAKNASLLTGQKIDSYSDLLLAERDLIVWFFEMADRRGLVLPDDSQQLRNELELVRSIERDDPMTAASERGWLMGDSALALVTLAQHYGAPTRLLDWTRSSFVAAYFAAEFALRENVSSSTLGRMVIWSLYFPLLGRHNTITKHDGFIRIVTAPGVSNANLKAQQGVFTSLHPSYTEEQTLNPLPMDEVLERLEERWEGAAIGCMMRKFTAPASEANELLRLLAKLDVTPSAIYPGYRSIVADLNMLARWR